MEIKRFSPVIEGKVVGIDDRAGKGCGLNIRLDKIIKQMGKVSP